MASHIVADLVRTPTREAASSIPSPSIGTSPSSDVQLGMTARANLEIELAALIRQRVSYLNAARTTADRELALRRLMTVERLTEEIECLGQALAAMDDSTQPISLHAMAR